ncbi:MAG: 30S ribosomal protein S2 [Patescibacteria group bacterium]
MKATNTDTEIKSEANVKMAEEMAKSQVEAFSEEDEKLLREMLENGVMYGHKKNKTNPKFKGYIFTNRNNIEIIDLLKTMPAIDAAAKFLKNSIKENKMILLIGIQPAAHAVIEEMAKNFNFPFVKNRWIGGLITNFKVIFQRLEYFKKTQAGIESGAFEKYTKKERVMINKSIEKMKKIFGGLERLTRVPEVLFVIDLSLKGHATAVREAKKAKIPVVAIIDSDDNPEVIDFPIPANDHAKMSIEWVINRVIEKLKD